MKEVHGKHGLIAHAIPGVQVVRGERLVIWAEGYSPGAGRLVRALGLNPDACYSFRAIEAPDDVTKVEMQGYALVTDPEELQAAIREAVTAGAIEWEVVSSNA